MFIQPITSNTSITPLTKTNSAKENYSNKALAFKANLKFDNKLLTKYRLDDFKTVMDKLRAMLKKESTFASDTLKIEECSFYIAQKTGNIKITPRKCTGVHDPASEGYCPSRTYTPPPFEYTYYESTARANLELTLNDKIKTGFYLDSRRTANELAEDFFNAYKHLRYLAHYAGPNEEAYEGNQKTANGYMHTIYNRFGKPLKEERSYYVNKYSCTTVETKTTKYKYDEKSGDLIDVETS